MRDADRKTAIELHKKWLSEDNRLSRWNHVRHRSGVPDLTLEQAAAALLDPKLLRDVREYLDD